MNALVDLIKKIGIFMIAAQAVIHFAPDIKYSKYLKLIVGILVLLQFLSPVYKIVSGMEANWGEQLSDMEQEFGAYELSENTSDTYSVSESVEESMEREIKYRLNNAISGDNTVENYVVTNVMIELERTGGNNENAVEYTLKSMRVVVWEHTEKADVTVNAPDTEDTGGVNNIDKIDKIQVDKIDISENGMEQIENKTTENLRGKFCSVLGMEEKYMEVIVYGAHKETDE